MKTCKDFNLKLCSQCEIYRDFVTNMNCVEFGIKKCIDCTDCSKFGGQCYIDGYKDLIYSSRLIGALNHLIIMKTCEILNIQPCIVCYTWQGMRPDLCWIPSYKEAFERFLTKEAMITFFIDESKKHIYVPNHMKHSYWMFAAIKEYKSEYTDYFNKFMVLL